MGIGLDLAEQEFQAFEQLLATHDRYYMYSDDFSVYKAGAEKSKRIALMKARLIEVDAERTERLYMKYMGR